MNIKFWAPFFLSVFICFFLAFFAGFSLKKFLDIPQKEFLLKQSVKLDSLLSLEQLYKKLSFLIKERARIQIEGEINPDSPFFALVLSDSLKPEKKVYIAKDQILLSSTNEGQIPLFSQEPNGKKSEAETKSKKAFKDQAFLEMEKTLIKLSQIDSSSEHFEDFQFQILKVEGEKRFFILFTQFDNQGGKLWAGFLKGNRDFFKLTFMDSQNKEGKSRELFVLNLQRRVLFHNKNSRLFKRLSKKSPLWDSLEELSQNQSLKGNYLKTHKVKKYRLYYLQKWNRGNLFLITQQELSSSFFALPFFSSEFFSSFFNSPFFLSKNVYFIGWGVGFAVFCLFFILFFLKYSSLVSSYRFLRLAFLSVSKTGVFPPVSSTKNPLLYFYNNRRLFLNNWLEENQNSQTKPSESLNFQEVVKQEVEKLKNKYPRLVIQEEFGFDVKIFGFEKFARFIVRELLINALEAMGGLQKPKLDLSITEEKENLVLSVRDYGPGVRSKDYKKLLRLYYSTKSQLGLGLSVVQSIVRANKGSVELSSPKEGGLRVCIRLPLQCFLKSHFEK